KTLRVQTSGRARLALRLLNYPAWRVEVNGRPVTPENAEGSDQMVLQVPAGTSQVHVQFVRTPDRTIGGAISIVALLVVAVLIVLAVTGSKNGERMSQVEAPARTEGAPES